MKVLLINPPYFKFFKSYNNRINIGLQSLAEIIYKSGYKPRVLNLDYSKKNKLISRASIFYNSKNPDYSILKKTKLQLTKYIDKNKPDYMIISYGDVANPSVDFCSPYINNKASNLSIVVRFFNHNITKLIILLNFC